LQFKIELRFAVPGFEEDSFSAPDAIPIIITVAVDFAEARTFKRRQYDLLKYAGGIRRDVKGNRQGKMV
jgi:hypothetical protein